MALKRLPNDVQSLLSASAQVNSFKRTIEELIYNSLDAESISIAIRIHIQESTIQVIDNGHGIAKHDFNLIGQRYVTSKVPDIATLKAAPKNYGFRGEFLANIITVSHMVKITSRRLGTEETWAKSFCDGKEKKFAKMTTRPSNGTTIDIKGFLHNLSIQRRGIDPINEMQSIKLFLEQLSLVHYNVSFSLRDDAKNEIAFKIHKKRDIYQTLSTLFDIDKTDIVELQVEKHEYKAKGLIGKTEKFLDLHWIYLNGKCIQSCSKLHTIINEYFRKFLHIKDQRRLKSKNQCDEHQLLNQNIPFYFIFLTCPYIDYDISFIPKQSVIEFKNWEKINKLLEKLVKFFGGDVNFKEIKKPENKFINKEQLSIKVNHDTRVQVKKIMEKILGSNSKKIGVSQLQNGVKGKLIRRSLPSFSLKKKAKRSNRIPRLLQNKQNENNHNSDNKTLPEINAGHIFEHGAEQDIELDKSPLSKYQNEIIDIPDTKTNQIKKKPKNKNKKETRSKINSPTKKIRPTVNKIIKKTIINYNDFQYLNETDSVYKKSKIVAQKVEDFLRHGMLKKIKANVNNLPTRNRKVSRRELKVRNSGLLRDTFHANDNTPVQPRLNNYDTDKLYVMNKLKTKSYKTTYDLIRTVLQSQQELLSAGKNNISEESYKGFQKRNDIIHFVPKASKRYTWTNKYVSCKYSNTDGKKGIYQNKRSPRFKTPENEDDFSDYQNIYNQQEISNKSNMPETFEYITREFYSRGYHFNCTQKETSFKTLSRPLTEFTYDSHQYHKNEVFVGNDIANCITNKKQNVRFITKQSTDNFVTYNNFKAKFKKSYKSVSKQPKTYDMCMKQRMGETQYTIECTKSNESNHYKPRNSTLANNVDYEENDCLKNKADDNIQPINDLNTVFGNTYTLSPSNHSFDINTITQIQRHNIQNPIKSNEQFETYTILDSYSEINHDSDELNARDKYDYFHNEKNFNIVFVSKSQRTQTETSKDISLEPLNICETVYNEIKTGDRELASNFNEINQLDDSLYDNFLNIDNGIHKWVENEVEQIIQDNSIDDITKNISHHFSSAVKTTQPRVVDIITVNKQNKITNAFVITEDQPNLNTEINLNAENIECNYEMNIFDFKNRHRFVPKGMSQIFENCRTKDACEYNLDKEYYEDMIYNNFAKEVQVNSEIYEPIVQNVEDNATKNIHKFQSKVKKDNASLIFDETSLKEARVLGQADCKFIAAIMKKRSCQSKEATEYLILFDQHAVHERIRLETNLADYLNEERWTCVPLENIILKMSKDQILYLHNYKDKFIQLGLQWTILNDNEVTVHSIPEAILGKNPREVEKVIKAVRNLILEEINVIKSQKGCLSLYPKSIMDLVFSEACRYAIKFGDQLSKNDCVDLLRALAKCKTPFQCAHGRPVMAVIMDIKADKRDYKINMSKLKQFKRVM